MSNQAVLPRRSKRLATIIPASHWISIGYSQERAQLMEKLQNDMKKYCDGNEDDIEVKGNLGSILQHHDMMLPHWQKFANGLRGRTSIKALTLMGISLPIPVLDIMFPALQSTNLEQFGLVKAGLGSDGFQCLSSFLKTNTSLKTLALCGDLIDDMSVASSLSDAVKGHPTLREIGFVECGLNNASILGKLLEGCSGLREFRLVGYEKLGMESVSFVADFIRCNHPMEVMNLQYNLTDNDASVLSSALNTNSNLKELILKSNYGITEEGEKALLKALYDPTSMDSIVESNHICKTYTHDIKNVWVVAQRPPIETEVLNINGDKDISIQQKIRKKVVLALCGVDGSLFDLSHLNDLPLQLMPRVLELIQEHTEDRTQEVTSIPPQWDNYIPNQLEKEALSRLFHTVRGWELPLLFENLDSSSSKGGGKKRKKRKTRR